VRSGRPDVRAALLLQEPDNQFVASSVRNELLMSAAGARGKMDEAVERFGLGRFLDRNPHRLSGGEKQRLALATVWLAEPELLLLDEPTSYLDAPSRDRCVEFVSGLNKDGVSVVWATPGGDDVLEARRAVYIEHGEIRFDGSCGAFVDAAVAQSFDVIPLGADRPAEEAGPLHRADRAGTTVVELRGASFAYGRGGVLRDISLEVRAGECLGVTLIRVDSGLVGDLSEKLDVVPVDQVHQLVHVAWFRRRNRSEKRVSPLLIKDLVQVHRKPFLVVHPDDLESHVVIDPGLGRQPRIAHRRSRQTADEEAQCRNENEGNSLHPVTSVMQTGWHASGRRAPLSNREVFALFFADFSG